MNTTIQNVAFLNDLGVNAGHGYLKDYEFGQIIRYASAKEQQDSSEAAQHDGGAGVITVDGRRCYVED